MRKALWVWVWVFVIGAIGAAAQRGADAGPAAAPPVGTWVGTWDSESAGSGGFELTLEKDKDGALGGRVSVTGEPAYKATLRSVSFEGARMTARYDFPPAPDVEVALSATFEGDKASGTWTVREKAGGNEAMNGTWKVARKP